MNGRGFHSAVGKDFPRDDELNMDQQTERYERARIGRALALALLVSAVGLIVVSSIYDSCRMGRCGYRLSDKEIRNLTQKASGGGIEAARKLQFHYESVFDEDKAVYWLRKAADNGDDSAKRELYNRLKYSKDADSRSEGVQYLTNAAENGDALAMDELADLYFKGDGVGVDPIEGEKWLRRAAYALNPIAINKLSVLIMKDRRDRKFIIEAYAWSHLATTIVSPGTAIGRDAKEQIESIKEAARLMGMSDLELFSEAQAVEREILARKTHNQQPNQKIQLRQQ